MKFKEIEFKDNNSTRIYKDYINRVKNSVRILDKDNQQEILLEINSHIYESIKDNSKSKGEVEHLLDVLEMLGSPEIFLKSLVAEKKLEEATKTFNPVKIAKALLLNIGNGFSYIVFTFLYIFLFGFLFLVIAKIINPENVGLFYRPNDVFILGHYSNSAGISYAQYEKLGNWFIPAMLLLSAVLYVLLTLLLKLKRTLKIRSI
ncbi:HAAS signaling domain-containing protein [Flavobacterium cerinum]|uniref:DUF1700 domain-containing protein n=1 Tax=Flavobacterium cerinum TaxID=2502784 RepID=A0A444GKY8_9FLAO|nr:hypothetical protein [Flavobacterium cerinum]RWW91654.1 hypothetical protein EPI11_18635 [Flavobacterium cerinum]